MERVSECKTYQEMNEKIKELLRMTGDNMDTYVVIRIEELEKQVAEITEERDDLRRQVETLTKARDNALDNCHRYKKACDDLVDLKEKQYAKIDELETQNAALCEILQDVLLDCKLSDGMRSEIERRLTASGENRYLKIEEVAKKIKNARAWCDHGKEQEAIRELLAALGDGE